jgi:hypothetical protein
MLGVAVFLEAQVMVILNRIFDHYCMILADDPFDLRR